MEWTRAAPGVPWRSLPGDTSKTALRGRWGVATGKQSAVLLDSKKFYKNELLQGGHEFLYQLPKFPKAQWEHEVIDLMQKGAVAFAADDVGGMVCVSIFCVFHARDHYLGEFVVSECTPGKHVRLARLERQRGVYAASRKRARSSSEARHYDVIRALCGEDWLIKHEPETATHLDAPYVLDGKVNDACVCEYTVDYIAARGSQRICFESKPNMRAVDDVALAKCRALRDGTLTRVVVVAGEDEFLDFGDPGSAFLFFFFLGRPS